MERIWIKDIKHEEGELVSLSGWVATRRDHGNIIFIDLKDKSGLIQVVFSKSDGEAYDIANELRPSWVINLEGTVHLRPEKNRNIKLATGDIEISAQKLSIYSKADTLPIDIDISGYDINENLRLKYRYLDLRRERLQKNLQVRHDFMLFVRNYLSQKGFTEIETPNLTRSTPEGARDYLVPARISPGNFYALPQSPQQYKQLLMVAQIERYFQFARCFRDEDARGDRQPEFTQLDIETSFWNSNQILDLIEKMIVEYVKTYLPEKHIPQIPFPRIEYKEAMEKYHSDKPDIRQNKEDNNELAFAFIVNFPMFEWKESEKRWDAVHHPFTQPKFLEGETVPDLITRITDNPGSVVADQYDLALNGFEAGGGSLRTYQPELLEKIFEIMGNSQASIEEKFGHLLEAFKYGVPPHGGIALGVDRLIAIFQNEPNIRETIAFPKNGEGFDPLMNSPASVDKAQIKELGIEINTIKNNSKK